MKIKALVVEDNQKLSNKIDKILKLEGFESFVAENLSIARNIIKKEAPTIMLLDLMLPDGMGYELISGFKEKLENWVIIISALDDVESKKMCYQYGADDYISKPFDLDVFICKIEAIKKRCQNATKSYVIGDITVDEVKETISTSKKTIEIPYAQIKFLKLLYQKNKKEEYVKKAEVVSHFLENMDDSNRVQAFVHRVRKNIQLINSEQVNIQTIYGKGYELDIIKAKKNYENS